MIWPLIIEMAGEPVAWARAGRKGGFSYTPAHTAKYAAALKIAAGNAMAGANPLDEALMVTVTASLPIPASWSGKKQAKALAGTIRPTSRPDGDNYLKIAQDACNTIVWRDDSVIVDARIVKLYATRPSLRIEVNILGPDVSARAAA